MPLRFRIWTIAFLCSFQIPATLFAHQWRLTEAIASFPGDGTYQVDFLFDYDAMLAEVPPGQMTEDIYVETSKHTTQQQREQKIEDIKKSLSRTIRIRFDGKVVQPESIEFPDIGKADPTSTFDLPPGPWPGHRARMKGHIPEGAQAFTFWASRGYGPIALRFGENGELPAINAPEDPNVLQLLSPAEESRPFSLHSAPIPDSRASVGWQYLVLGFTHILPKGLDHILFVLGLFLLSMKLKPLLWQVTAFTVAHSVSLGLSMFGIVSLSPRIVEPIIALSIAFIAIENLFTTKLKPWRPAVVFLFGLIHGLGFAGVLSELGLPRERFLTALLTFNVGVELGQLTVIALAMLAVGWYRNKEWYHRRITVPASAMIALVAIYWTIQRTFS